MFDQSWRGVVQRGRSRPWNDEVDLLMPALKSQYGIWVDMKNIVRCVIPFVKHLYLAMKPLYPRGRKGHIPGTIESNQISNCLESRFLPILTLVNCFRDKRNGRMCKQNREAPAECCRCKRAPLNIIFGHEDAFSVIKPKGGDARAVCFEGASGASFTRVPLRLYRKREAYFTRTRPRKSRVKGNGAVNIYVRLAPLMRRSAQDDTNLGRRH